MIEEPKGVIRFAGPGIDLGKRRRCLRSIKCVLGFRQQFESASAFGDRFLFSTQEGKDKTQLSVSSGVLRSFRQEFLRESARVLERKLRLLFIAQIQINHPFKKGLW